jgi:hypothetical protein
MRHGIRCRDEICISGPAINEDLIGRTQAAAWVIDGASGADDRKLTAEASDAVWLAKTLDATLRQEFTASQQDADAAFERISSRIFDAFSAIAGKRCGDDRVACPSACLAFLSVACRQIEISYIGDCRVILELPEDGLCIASDMRIERFENLLLKDLIDLIRREPDADPKSALRERFRATRGFLNRSDGYWVVHPTVEWLRGLQKTAAPAFEGQTVLLVSDGFYRLVNLFGAHTDRSLLAAAKERGLKALLKTLRELEERESIEDYPRMKRHDDASACLIEIAA